MDPRLQLAIENDDVDDLHRLIVEKRQLLDRASKDPFPNTPLYVAAAAGKTRVAMEMAILKPSFAWKLNPEGYSPMHLALQHEHYHTVRALITLNPKLIRVQERCGITPLCYVVGKEGDCELELLAEFLYACRSSIEDLTSRCETPVQIVVKSHNLQAFKVLFGWLKRTNLTRILHWKDQDDNNVLHVVMSKNQPEIIKLLIGYTNINANFQDKTALEIFQVNPNGNRDVAKRLRRQGCRARLFTPTLSLSQFFSMELTAFEKCKYFFRNQDESARNIILVVATLIAAATYQAALSPPGGYWQDSSSIRRINSPFVTANSSGIAIEKPQEARNVILAGPKLNTVTFYNSMAFFASIGTIWATAFTQMPSTFMVFITISVLCPAYVVSLIVEIPKSDGYASNFQSALYDFFLFTVLLLPWYAWIKHFLVLK